jgi:hypothetical protein
VRGCAGRGLSERSSPTARGLREFRRPAKGVLKSGCETEHVRSEGNGEVGANGVLKRDSILRNALMHTFHGDDDPALYRFSRNSGHETFSQIMNTQVDCDDKNETAV